MTRCGSIPATRSRRRTSTWPWSASCAAIWPAPRPSWRSAARRAEQLGFPQGPFSLAYARFVEIWVRIEAGQLDRAAVLAADLSERAERHGFDMWRLSGAT